MKHCVYVGGKKYIILNTLFVKNILLFCNLVFQLWHFHWRFSWT